MRTKHIDYFVRWFVPEQVLFGFRIPSGNMEIGPYSSKKKALQKARLFNGRIVERKTT